MNKLLKFFIIIFPFIVLSQSITTSNDVLKGLDFQNKLIDKSIIKKIKFENIGPSIMSGRVSDIEVNPKNSNEFYVAYASGGLWHTINNGNTFLQKSLPLYLKFSVDPNGENYDLNSKVSKDYSNPMFLDTEGVNYIRSKLSL